MSTTGVTLNPYDEIPFPSQPLPLSHPDHLAALGRLFGMQPPPIDRCRVLELGCATGGNLLPMAERLPDSHFVGIDYSQAQLIEGQRTASQLELHNVELRHADIADLPDDLGPFDYIICHGVFSWVSPALQDKILGICRGALTPQGVAYISYNTFPGWHVRSVIRELLCRHAPADKSSVERIARGKELLDFFSTALEREGTAAAAQLKADIDAVRGQPESYVFHEYFEGENRPEYFHEFIEHASRFGLQYLAEASVATMFASNFGARVEQRLSHLTSDLVSGEQHLDVLRSRAFRQTLLCRDNVPLVRRITPAQLQGLYFSARMRAESSAPDLKSSAVEKFTARSGVSLSSPSPLLKATLYQLNLRWPRSASFDELEELVAQTLGSDGKPAAISDNDRAILGQNLIQCIASGLLDITSAPDNFVTTVSERPLASRWAQAEARAGLKVTSRRHLLIDLDQTCKNVLCLLDGRHDRAAILREMLAGAAARRRIDSGRRYSGFRGSPRAGHRQTTRRGAGQAGH